MKPFDELDHVTLLQSLYFTSEGTNIYVFEDGSIRLGLELVECGVYLHQYVVLASKAVETYQSLSLEDSIAQVLSHGLTRGFLESLAWVLSVCRKPDRLLDINPLCINPLDMSSLGWSFDPPRIPHMYIELTNGWSMGELQEAIQEAFGSGDLLKAVRGVDASDLTIWLEEIGSEYERLTPMGRKK